MLNKEQRRTKIVWSFETDKFDIETISTQNPNHYDCLRLVYEGGSTSNVRECVQQLESQCNELPAIMIDIASRVRATTPENQANTELSFGEKVCLAPAHAPLDNAILVKTDVWNELFSANSSIHFGYGDCLLKPNAILEDRVEAEVLRGGMIRPSSDIHVPDTRRKIPPVEFENDEFIELLKKPISHLVIPGYCEVEDILILKSIIAKHASSNPAILLKLHTQETLDALPSLLEHVDGVFISRLELSLRCDPSTIPLLVKQVGQECHHKAKMVITASEMLGSMRHQPTPTRAEVSDIANAVQDNHDAVVLSEEVSQGLHSSKAVRIMHEIILDMEQDETLRPNWRTSPPNVLDEMDSIAHSAYRCARRVGAKAICCLTRAGNTAAKISSFRTSRPIIALTFEKNIAQRLKLVRGVSSIVSDVEPDVDKILDRINSILLDSTALELDDKYIFVSVTLSSLSSTDSNLFTVQTLHKPN